jgi:CheY-like chemotaxis protein
MPRLLLVDDNPSIHRIAESLLAPTDVELVCVDSAAEALDRIARGERFDVALVDTAMPGMDGWTLLGRLRAMEETARMPIALMAGVLDPVDPAKLAKAPIQGFLKKPIELRELGERVKTLLVTPVPAGPSPFSTVPATPARELVQRAEAALPEFRHDVVSEPEPVPEFESLEEPAELPAAPLALADPEADLLVLNAEDLWPEEVAPPAPEPSELITSIPDVHLELEELDLDGLQDLASPPLPEPMSIPEPMPEPTMAEMEPVAVDVASEPAPAVEAAPVLESVVLPDDDDHLVTLSGLEDLDILPAEFELPPPPPPPVPVVEPVDLVAPAAAAAVAGGLAIAGLSAVLPEALPAPVIHVPSPVPEAPVPVIEPAAGGQMPAVPGHAAPVSGEQAQALLQALLADPVLVDALVKAVVARMGDQVIREIAWEVMPDLAGRLQR